MKLGIGSFSYRYAIGNKDFIPHIPMDLFRFAESAKKLGYQRIQICENLNYTDENIETLYCAAQYMADLKLEVELGLNGLSPEALKKHLDLCKVFQCSLLRVVIGHGEWPQEKLYQYAFETILDIVPQLEQEGITLGIENHFDLTTDNIIRLIRELNSVCVRAIYDTTNSIGFIEAPMETLDKLLPYCVSAHIKDYEIQKVEAGYQMQGKILGTGHLDLPRLKAKFESANDLQSLILEMTICRRTCAPEEEVLAEEQEQICKSTRCFVKTFGDK